MQGLSSSPNTPTKVITTLIVEDFVLFRKGLVVSLEDYDSVQVIGDVDSAEEALDFIQYNRPDVVLMDLGLGGMNGIKATQVIKSMDPSIKVLILTSHEHENEVTAAFAAGANGYCTKDIQPDRLVQVMQVIMNGGAWLDPSVAKVALQLFQHSEPSYDVPSEHHSVSTGSHGLMGLLTEQELIILEYLVQGKSDVAISRELGITSETVNNHVASLLTKLQVDSRVQAAGLAIDAGLVRVMD